MAAKKDLRASLSGLRGGLPTASDMPLPFGSALREELEQQAETLPVAELRIENLLDNPYQHLSRPEPLDDAALDELAASIRTNGFYGALLARPHRGRYQLAYGHRRREAARRAGLETLPVKVLDLSDTEMARIMASENFSRENLTPLGEANIVGYMSNTLNMSVREIAEAIGKGRRWVERRMELFQAPADLQQMVETKPDALSHITALKTVSDPAQRQELVEAVLNDGLTVKEMEQRIKQPKIVTTGGNREIFHISDDSRLQEVMADIDAIISRENNPKLKAAPAIASIMTQMETALTELERAARSGHPWNMAERGQLADFTRRLRQLQE